MGHAQSTQQQLEWQRRLRAATMLNNSIVSGRASLKPRASCPDVLTTFDVKQLLMLEMRHREEQLLEEEKREDHNHSSLCSDSESEDMKADENDKPKPKTSICSIDSVDSGNSTMNSIDAILSCVPSTSSYSLALPKFPSSSANNTVKSKKYHKRKRFFLNKSKSSDEDHRVRSKSLSSLSKLDARNGDKQAPLFGSSLLNREWELVTVREMCRRLSLDEIDQIEMPIPDGAKTSQILDEVMIRQMMEILPPRAEGYPWVNIYNSEKHGFSLATLYRKMAEFDEDLSPVLLIIRDTRERVFGAVVSSAIRPSDHFFGTGDSCLLWRFTGQVPHTRELRHFTWTGDNQFFCMASKDSLVIGAGGGHNGLWLDADLNHGRSQRCDTFDNEILTGGEKGDFIVQFVEAYGFRM